MDRYVVNRFVHSLFGSKHGLETSLRVRFDALVIAFNNWDGTFLGAMRGAGNLSQVETELRNNPTFNFDEKNYV